MAPLEQKPGDDSTGLVLVAGKDGGSGADVLRAAAPDPLPLNKGGGWVGCSAYLIL